MTPDDFYADFFAGMPAHHQPFAGERLPVLRSGNRGGGKRDELQAEREREADKARTLAALQRPDPLDVFDRAVATRMGASGRDQMKRGLGSVEVARLKLASWMIERLEGTGHVIWFESGRDVEGECQCDRCQMARTAFRSRDEWQLIGAITG